MALLENARILAGAVFYTPILTDMPDQRRRFFRGMMEHFRAVDLIFFDPNNGSEVESVPFGSRGSSKYLYWHELAEAYSARHSVLVYQHFPRRARDVFIDETAESIRSHTSDGAHIYSFRTPKVVFFLASRPEHADCFGRRAGEVASVGGNQIRVSTHWCLWHPYFPGHGSSGNSCLISESSSSASTRNVLMADT